MPVKQGDVAIVQCEHYRDIGIIDKCWHEHPIQPTELKREQDEVSKGRKVQGRRVPEIVRVANQADAEKNRENMTLCESNHNRAFDEIRRMKLPMKLINSHISFDHNLIIFQFSAEGRVDFRELLRSLSQMFHCRVELRQIGVRDEAAVQGGLGSCGRPFCCSTFLKQFVSINVRMAKEQGLSLNPNNISGVCGRLKCCLKYENDQYREMKRDMPRPGCMCCTPEGEEGRVVEVSPLKGCVKVCCRKAGGHDTYTEYPVDEIKVSGGKHHSKGDDDDIDKDLEHLND